MLHLPSPNHGPRPDGERVELLVLHYTGMRTAETALRRLCDPASQVSAHYTVDEDGTVYAHVPEERRAWHAGVSRWRGRDDVNSRSVGIEIVNPGHEWGYRPFPPVQMEAVARLCRAIVGRHGIAADGVLGHSDVAPARKRDPGELFDWRWLAAEGVGLWPEPVVEDFAPWSADEVPGLLARFGYDPAEPAALSAFQRRFRPDGPRGEPDGETVACLRALLRQTSR